jgi:hypothetical protein
MRTPDQIWQALSDERERICKEIYNLFGSHNISTLFVGAGATEDDNHDYCYCNVYNPSIEISEESVINCIEVRDAGIRITPRDERFGDVCIEDCNIVELAGIYETSYQLLEEGLMVADKNGHQIYVGCNVKWNDPALNEYNPQEREEMANRTFRVYRLKGDIVCISNETIEVEVLPEELEVIDK